MNPSKLEASPLSSSVLMAFKLRWETLRCSVMADRSGPFIVVFRDEPSIDGIANPKGLKPDQL